MCLSQNLLPVFGVSELWEACYGSTYLVEVLASYPLVHVGAALEHAEAVCPQDLGHRWCGRYVALSSYEGCFFNALGIRHREGLNIDAREHGL